MGRTWGVASIVAAGLILAPVGAAAAQPTQSGNGVLIIGQYEAAGYDVVIDRVGSAPLDQCTVTNVRNPQERTRTFWTGKDEDRERITVVVGRSITVSLNCGR